MRAGDNSVDIEIQLIRKDGTLQPLTGSETMSFIWSTWRGVDTITKIGSISDVTNSKVKCTMLAADTSTLHGQVFRGRVPVTFVGGALETFPTAQDDLLLEIS
jgi:hypothetical protein